MATPTVAAVFGLVALVAAISFGQSNYPLLFLPRLVVIIAVFWLGPLGAAGGVLTVAVIGSAAIGVGSGPLAPVHASPLIQGLSLQFYLLTLYAAALPIAALLTARTRIALRLSEKMRLLQLAESAAHFGHPRRSHRRHLPPCPLGAHRNWLNKANPATLCPGWSVLQTFQRQKSPDNSLSYQGL